MTLGQPRVHLVSVVLVAGSNSSRSPSPSRFTDGGRPEDPVRFVKQDAVEESREPPREPRVHAQVVEQAHSGLDESWRGKDRGRSTCQSDGFLAVLNSPSNTNPAATPITRTASSIRTQTPVVDQTAETP